MFASIVLMMTGCGTEFPEMTQEQTNQVGEYAAMLLLKYDANNRSRLVSEEVVEQKDQELLEKAKKKAERDKQKQEAEEQKTENDADIINDNENMQVTQISLEEFLDLPAGVSASYLGYITKQSYPEESDDSYFSLDASAGRELVVFSFSINNASGMDWEINFIDTGMSATLTLKDGTLKRALTTMLLDDMLTYKGNIADGASETVVIIFETDVDKVSEEGIKNLSLKIDSNKYTIQP